MLLPKLAITNLNRHRVRTGLTVAAIALAVSLVVAVTAGYKSIQALADRFLDHYYGAIDAQITPAGARGIPIDIFQQIQQDPAVAQATERVEARAALTADPLESDQPAAQHVHGRMAHLIGLRTIDKPAARLQMVQGRWFQPADALPEAVIDQSVAETLNLKLGDALPIPRGDKQLQLTVVGIVHKPEILAAQMKSIYLPIEVLKTFLGGAGAVREVGQILIELKPDADPQLFASRWRDRLAQLPEPPKLQMTVEARARVMHNLEGIHLLSYLGGTISLLAATFIIFTALSMGVTERARILAMLRAIGAYKRQLGGLVVLEGLLLSSAGIIVGVPLGWLWMRLLAAVPRFHEFFAAGVILDWTGIAFAAVVALLAALAASLLPAWSAMRVDPLEAMNSASAPTAAHLSRWCALIGLLLISVDPLLMGGLLPWLLQRLGVDEARQAARIATFIGHFALGLPCLMVGFFLLAPLFVVVVERLLGPLVALLLGLRFALLRQQLSSGVWRAAGTAAALMVGLSVLIAMQTQGHTMLSGWKLPDKFPDIFLADVNPTPFGALTVADIPRLQQVEGIKDGQVMAIAFASPQLGNSLASVAMLGMVPDATMFFGVDPDVAGQMMELDFREGTPEQAWQLLKKGRHLLITNEFKNLRDLHVGDKFPLKTDHGEVDYTIAGVVWSPGLDVIKSVYDMGGQFEQRTAFSVFGTLEDARRDFGVTRIHLFAANLVADKSDLAISKEQLLKNIRRQVGGLGLRAGDVRQIKHQIQHGFGNLLLLASTVAFAALAVASLGVTNTILASIRTRTWHFGILRSIGVTRSQLLRLVLAEALLLGLVGVALGLAAGLELAIDARWLSATVLGYAPPLTVPWNMVLIGAATVLLIALLASLLPAFQVSRRQPLSLLQAGRAAT